MWSKSSESESMQQVSYKTHLAQTRLSQGKLIKQHYQGGAVFQVAKSSLLIPIPGFTRFCTCVCNNCLYCTMGHKKNKTVWCSCVLGPLFSWKPSGACSQWEGIRRVTWAQASLAHDNVSRASVNEWLGQRSHEKPQSRAVWWPRRGAWTPSRHKNPLRWHEQLNDANRVSSRMERQIAWSKDQRVGKLRKDVGIRSYFIDLWCIDLCNQLRTWWFPWKRCEYRILSIISIASGESASPVKPPRFQLEVTDCSLTVFSVTLLGILTCTHTRSTSLSSFLPLPWKRMTEWVIAVLYILARSTRRPHSHRARLDNGCIRINWSDIWWVYLSLFVECNEWKWPLSPRLTDPCTALQLRLCHFPLLLYRYAWSDYTFSLNKKNTQSRSF